MLKLFKNKLTPKALSALDWILVNSVKGEVVAVLSNEKNIFFVSDGSKLVKTTSAERDVLKSAFIIVEGVSNLGKYSSTHSLIYEDFDFQLLEDVARHKGLIPVRFGLNESEKKELLSLARCTMLNFFDSKEIGDSSKEILLDFERLGMTGGAGVAVWVEGEVRGSMIIDSGLSLRDSVVKASKLAVRDLRFKPVTKIELSSAQIEITIISEVKIIAHKQEINYNNGYLAVSNDIRGWYIPEVFNCRNFWSYSEFRDSLLLSKAKLPAGTEYQLFNFTVQDFIDNNNHFLNLNGPIVDRGATNLVDEAIFMKAKSAADWICASQEYDGNIPAIIDVISGCVKQRTDWVRLTFVAWALSDFGVRTKDPMYVSAAEKAYSYFEKYFIDENPVNMDPLTLGIAYSYAGKYLLSAHCNDKAKMIEKRISGIDDKNINIFSAINILSFRVRFAVMTHSSFGNQIDLFFNLVSKFKEDKTKPETQIATYPELAVVASELYKHFGEEVYQEIATEIYLWLKGHQLSDGSFKARVGGGLAYTRGTTKVFEVLSVDNQTHSEAIELSLSWIDKMQYNSFNTFFVKDKNKPRIIGSLRSGVGNTDAWIDSAAHFIIGVSRLNLSSFDTK